MGFPLAGHLPGWPGPQGASGSLKGTASSAARIGLTYRCSVMAAGLSWPKPRGLTALTQSPPNSDPPVPALAGLLRAEPCCPLELRGCFDGFLITLLTTSLVIGKLRAEGQGRFQIPGSSAPNDLFPSLTEPHSDISLIRPFVCLSLLWGLCGSGQDLASGLSFVISGPHAVG